jgi:ornithine decarboxylase
MAAHGTDRLDATRALLTATIEKHQLDEESFYVVDLGRVNAQLDMFVEGLPGVRPYFAVKCCPNPAIMSVLRARGTGFDCASAPEIKQVLAVGGDVKDILFAHPCKPLAHIARARALGVRRATFDNIDELYKVAAHWPEVELLLRIRTDDSAAVCQFSTKFGAPMYSVQSLLDFAFANNLKVIGVAFHVGSGQSDPTAFVRSVHDATRVFAMAAQIGLAPMRVLDIGGGFPGDHSSSPSFPTIAAALRPVLAPLQARGVEVIAEPGRFFAAASHTLVVNVLATRTLHPGFDASVSPARGQSMTADVCTGACESESVSQNPVRSTPSPTSMSESSSMEPSVGCAGSPTTLQKEVQYYVNDGVYQSFNCLFFDHVKLSGDDVHPLHPRAPPAGAPAKVVGTLFGPTCDGLDCIVKRVPLPHLMVGDWLFFVDFGAYTTAAQSSFNGFGTHQQFYVNSSASLHGDEQ